MIIDSREPAEANSIIKKAVLILPGAEILCFSSFGLAGCNKQYINVSFERLMSDPDRYNGRDIIVEGYFYQGFETIVLSEQLYSSGYVDGHLIPKGQMIWINGRIPRNVYDRLDQQETMGPIERYGKVSINGLFEYGGEYGHLGQFEFQLTPSLVKLLNSDGYCKIQTFLHTTQ